MVIHPEKKTQSSISGFLNFLLYYPPFRLGQYSFRGLMKVIATGFIPSLTAVRCFSNGNVGKQPVAWKEYRVEYWRKELQESMDRCTGRCDIIEILLNTIHLITQSIIFSSNFIKARPSRKPGNK